mmetsp:Transcript_23473/g.70532  ORF Transcript_23473/g.70532 Transcript_23473/m.70532 type:complete len:265 (+) Transcript_23473:756-1550(+)
MCFRSAPTTDARIFSACCVLTRSRTSLEAFSAVSIRTTRDLTLESCSVRLLSSAAHHEDSSSSTVSFFKVSSVFSTSASSVGLTNCSAPAMAASKASMFGWLAKVPTFLKASSALGSSDSHSTRPGSFSTPLRRSSNRCFVSCNSLAFASRSDCSFFWSSSSRRMPTKLRTMCMRASWTLDPPAQARRNMLAASSGASLKPNSATAYRTTACLSQEPLSPYFLNSAASSDTFCLAAILLMMVDFASRASCTAAAADWLASLTRR